MPLVWSMAHQRGVKALPGYSIFDTPWAGTKTNTGWSTRSQAIDQLGGGGLETNDGNQNNLLTEDHWLAQGTHKLVFVHAVSTNRGIYNVTGVNGTQLIDGYAATAPNAFTEVTGVSVTAGLKTIQIQMATKNAASAAYRGSLQTMAWIRTGA